MTSAKISDLEIWRAAQQMLNQYPEDPEIAAAQRADAAYEQGDMFNFDLWTRINKAVRDLQRKRGPDDPLN